MEHTYYFDGNEKMISWMIKSNETKSEQKRLHAEYYYDKVSPDQSKYIALHVGIFWGIGRFIIKNGDTVKVMIDQKSMFEHLVKNKKIEDPFLEKRAEFIMQLASQRNLEMQYQFIDPQENHASKLLIS